jgi:transcriptional regulator of heat shock response
MEMKNQQIDKHVWKIEANKKLNVSIVNSSMSLATLQVMQDNSSVDHFAQIRSMKISENKTTMVLTGNKETANVFSKVLGTNAPNVNIVEIPEETKK